jgi:hypothetical protein
MATVKTNENMSIHQFDKVDEWVKIASAGDVIAFSQQTTGCFVRYQAVDTKPASDVTWGGTINPLETYSFTCTHDMYVRTMDTLATVVVQKD